MVGQWPGGLGANQRLLVKQHRAGQYQSDGHRVLGFHRVGDEFMLRFDEVIVPLRDENKDYHCTEGENEACIQHSPAVKGKG